MCGIMSKKKLKLKSTPEVDYLNDLYRKYLIEDKIFQYNRLWKLARKLERERDNWKSIAEECQCNYENEINNYDMREYEC